jgi:putative peptidoglycan lipid II flippase
VPDLRRHIVLLAAAVVVSGILQMAWQWAAARRCGLRLPLRLDTTDPSIRRIGIIMLPMIAGMATVQLNTLADTLIAYWFVPGRVGPGILAYAQRLYQFPLGIFAIALATAIFPAMSRFAAQQDLEGLRATLSRGLRVASFEGIPCLVGLILVREPLIQTLFNRGEFARDPQAVERVGLAVLMYALGIWAFGLNQLLVRAFYALGNARAPLRVSLINMVLNLALNLVLVRTVLMEAGLALATSICACLQVVVLLILFNGEVKSQKEKEKKKHAAETFPSPLFPLSLSIARTLVAAAVMGALVHGVDMWLNHLIHPAPAIRLAILVLVGAASYVGAAWLLRSEELRELISRRTPE